MQSLTGQILSSYSQIEEHKTNINSLIEEMLNQKKIFEVSIEDIQEKEQVLDQTIEKINLIEKENMKAHVESLSSKLQPLEKSEAEMKLVQDKFLEIEDLIEDVDLRKNQINSLQHKIEELRTSMHSDITKIEKIEHSAEEKVKKLAEFMQAVDSYIPDISKKNSILQNKKKQQTTEKIENYKEVIVKLDSMGWKTEEIANNLGLDKGTVNTILSTIEF